MNLRMKKLLAPAILSVLALLGNVAKGDAIWTAYNDCIRTAGFDTTAENATDWTIYSGSTIPSTGKLKDFATGSDEGMPTVTFTMNTAVPVLTHTDYGDNFAPGTPAYEVFDGIIDFGGTIIQHSSNDGWWVEIQFTGLDPAKTYTFVASAVRLAPADMDRRSLITIQDADAFNNNSGYNSSVGDPSWVGTDTTKFLAVENATEGVVVRWDDIEPGPDGDFTIRTEADSSFGSNGRRGYALHGFMLQQVGPLGNQPPQVDAGIDQETTLPDNTVNLDATVTDDGLGDPNGFLEFSWSKVSGPGDVTFEPNQSVENPTAVLDPVKDGTYVLRLTATDGEFDNTDDVTITVHESICPIGDITGNCIVDGEDLKALAEQYLILPAGSADLNADNEVQTEDFAYLALNWDENRQKGSVQVTITPQEAIDAGAQWQVDDGDWQDSSYTQGDVVVGTRTVRFSTVTGWDTPAEQQLQVNFAETTATSGTYVRQEGSLIVLIAPTEAIAAGAQWRIDGGEWNDSGYLQTNLTVGSHTVEFKTVSDWVKPPNQAVQIDKDATAMTSGTYAELPDTTVVINEFMAVNSYVPSISTQNIYTQVYAGDTHPDWIELSNLDPDVTIDLEGWYLTNDEDDLTKWKFPSAVTIAPDGYYVLFASGKTYEQNPGNYPYIDGDGALHTNFGLGAGGGYLALVKPDGMTVAHEYRDYPEQRGFVSYGFGSTGPVGYLESPTTGSRVSDKYQGAANSDIYDGVVEDTKFNHDRGFYYEPFSVTITCQTIGATIRYTTDGSEPTTSHGTVGGGPIQIDTTTCLRAIAYKTGWLSSNIDAQSYIFPEDVVTLTQEEVIARGYPTTIAGYPGDYGMDPEIYDDPDYRDDMVDALLAIPTLSVSTDKDNLFGSSNGIYSHPTSTGISWERHVSAEFFDVNGTKEWNANCGIRVQGGASRNPGSGPKHSLSLRFRGGYGPGQLESNIFPETAADTQNSLQLRAMYNNSWIHWSGEQRSRGSMIRDQWARDCLLEMGQISGGNGTYAHLYFNGIYWGVYNIHERPEASHYDSYHGGGDDQLDALNSGSAVDGSSTSWNSLQNLVANAVTGGITLAEFQEIQQKLDVVNLIDYMIVNHYGENDDWDGHNWRAGGGGENDMPWRIFAWDTERILENPSDNRIGTNNSGKPSALFHNLRNSEEFKLLFADRLHKHFFNNGAMTPTNTAARWMERATELDLAIICESARWGDYRRDVHQYSGGPYVLLTKNDYWLPEQSRLIGSYFPGRSTTVFNSYKNSYGLYPSLAAPVFTPHGGWDQNGFTLTMSTPATVYYTTDGTDPRLPGGAVNTASAQTYSAALNITASAHVKARAKSGDTWSALNEAVFAVGPVAESLRITEIMYHPKNTGNPDDPNKEFIELMNVGATAINLNLVKFTNGVDFTFPSIDLGVGELIVVVKDQAAFAAQYPEFTGVIAGQYSGSLDNGGERIELEDALDQTIQNFRYRDGWFSTTDGLGFSLTIRDPNSTDPNDWGRRSGWRTSAWAGGSPGFDDTGTTLERGTVVINEVLAHSHDYAPDWIELHNTTNEFIDIGGWFLSDNDPNFMKYEIAEGTVMDPCGYFIVYEDPNFGVLTDPGTHEPFALSENGQTVYLHIGLDGELGAFMDQEDFGASETGVSFGRYVTSTGDDKFTAMDHNTPNEKNAYPKIGPVVITELMYHPSDPCDPLLYDDDDFEYIELYNTAASPVTLQEWDNELSIYVPWQIRGVSFIFDLGTTIDPYTYLIVARNPDGFTHRYGTLPLGVQLHGPCGKMQNDGESIQLVKPGDQNLDTPEFGDYHLIRIDRVEYSDGSHPPDGAAEDPWPIMADGTGYSLTRTWPQLYGNDPNNWTAQPPTPGQ